MDISGRPPSGGPGAGLQVELLGRFALVVEGRPVSESAWRLRKAETLVKLLSLREGHRLHREEVVELLWPGRDPAAARNNLHQVLHVARSRLGDGAAGRRRLRLTHDVVALAPEDPLWIDADAFAAAARAALAAADPAAAGEALALYGGELLPGDRYEAWTEPARRELGELRDRVAVLAHGHGGPVAPDIPRPRGGDNLPAELTRFIGREDELDEVARLLGRGPLLTLTGPAGCGKTRLALQLAARQRDDFRDGACLVELAPLAQPELLAEAVAAAVGVPLRARADPEAVLREALAGRELLLVLDNCEHLVADAARFTEGLLRVCPELQVLATSREPLGITGEIAWRVRSLTLPAPGTDPAEAESVRLFADRAATARPGFELEAANTTDVARICRRLDGMPLAIELAAARVAALAPAEIADRLNASFLLRQGRRTAVTRQRTLEAALDWSYRLLDEGERALLRRLAAFAGTFGLDAAEAVCAGPPLQDGEVLDDLMGLVDKSLVSVGDAGAGSGYRLLEMIRHYARERLDEAGETAERLERHARWYAGRLTRAGSPPDVERLDRDQDNLRAALAWLLDHDPPAALRMAASLGDYWLLRGRLAEGRTWLERAVARTPEATRDVATALLGTLGFVGRSGDVTESARLAQRSLAIFRGLGDRAGASAALHALGLISWVQGDYAVARQWLTQALEEAGFADSPQAVANAAHGLGTVAISAGDLPEARAQLSAALAVLEGLAGDAEPSFLVVGTLCPVTTSSGFPERVLMEESQVMFRRVAPRSAPGYVLLNVAVAARLEGDLAGARAVVGDALARLQAGGDQAGVAQALAARGRLAAIEGDPARAREALERSLALRRRLGDHRAVGITIALLGEVAAQEGDPDRARSLMERAVAMFQHAGDRPPTMFVLLALGHLELAAGRENAARRRVEESRAVAEQLATRVGRCWTQVALAEVELHGGAHAAALRLLEDARTDFEAAANRWGALRCEALAKRVLSGLI
jgi:predicted ATPase